MVESFPVIYWNGRFSCRTHFDETHLYPRKTEHCPFPIDSLGPHQLIKAKQKNSGVNEYLSS